VIYDELVYLAVGQDPDHRYAPGHLWCIDPTKRGDVSPELVYDKSDPTTPVDQQRLDPFRPFDPQRHVVRPNPNSALVWHFGGKDKRQRFNNIIFGRTLSSPAIKDDLLVIADLAGFVHCLDAKTGQSYWKYDTLSQIWASPLIADGKIYIADDDGEVSVFRLSADPKIAMNEVDFKFRPIAENLMEGSIKSAAVVANDVLYIHTSSRLYAIAQPRSNVARSPLSSLEPTGREPGS
jgi:outer membrane protein assembly factor BamB